MLQKRRAIDMPAGLEREFRVKTDFLAGESPFCRKAHLHGERAVAQRNDWRAVTRDSEFAQSDSRRRDAMLIIGHEIFADDGAVRRDQILHGMRDTLRAQLWRNIGVQNTEAANHGAIGVGEQRKSDPMLLCEIVKSLRRIVADRGDSDAFLFEKRSGLFQLDELGAAVASPIRAAIEDQ